MVFRVDVQSGEAAAFFRRQFVGISFRNSQLAQTAQHYGRKLAASIFRRRAKALEHLVVVGAALMKHARINGGCQKIIGRDDGVNISSEMEIELLHRNDLAIAATGSAAFNAEGRALAGLADACKYFLAQVRAQRLAEANGGGGFTFTEGRWGDGGDHDVFSVWRIFQPVANGEMYFGFALAVQIQFLGKNTGLGRDLIDGKGRGGLSDFDIAGHTRQDVR